VKGLYCAPCKADLAEADVKDGACAKCGQKAAKAEYCERTCAFYQPACHPEKTSDKPITCCGKTYREKARDRARVTYACEACGAAADLEAEFKHKDDCKRKSAAPKKVCPKSGAPPHSK